MVTPLTKAARAAMKPEQFAVASTKQLPLHDADHVKLSWSTLPSTKGLSHVQRVNARGALLARAQELGIHLNTSSQKWGSLDIAAMALNIATDDDHPNKMPFSGILTYIDRPSDSAPHGSAGRLVSISMEAAKAALPSLLGMAVNYRPKFDGHDAQEKIGLITEATIDGDKIRIAGFLYAADFPEAAATIQAMKDDLGFSFEAKKIVVKDIDADLLEIESMAFTGASILLKDKAAYLNTSLAASADEDDDMTPEQAKMLEDLSKALPAITAMATGFDDLKKKVDTQAEIALSAANMLGKVEPLAKNLEAQATSLEAAGIGGHATRGHAVVLRNMAASLRASAAMGSLPSTFDGMYFAADQGSGLEDKIKAAVDAATKPLTDKLGVAETTIADLKAAAVKSGTGTGTGTGTTAPVRKSVEPGIQAAGEKTLKKINLNAGENPLAVGVVDAALKAANIFGPAATAAKIELNRAGLME
jgi:hypothetical protein